MKTLNLIQRYLVARIHFFGPISQVLFVGSLVASREMSQQGKQVEPIVGRANLDFSPNLLQGHPAMI